MQHFSLEAATEVGTKIYSTALKGVLFLKASVHEDERGFYSELSILPDLNQQLPQPFAVQQINLSVSAPKVARGFHAENWNKLASVLAGRVLAVLADIRPDSPTFKQTMAFELGEGDTALWGSIFIPAGVANSFLVLDGPAHYLYGVDQLYRERDRSGDQAVSLFDPELAVEWPLAPEDMQLSERDRAAKTLKELGL